MDGRTDPSTRVLKKSSSRIVLEIKGGEATFRNSLVHLFQQNKRIAARKD